MDRKKIFCHYEERTTTGYADIRDIPFYERLSRALKLLGILWGIALFCVLIPALHFVLVPLFLVLGLVFGVAEWMTKREILQGEIACPSCGTINSLAKQDASFPKTKRCIGCHISIELKEQ